MHVARNRTPSGVALAWSGGKDSALALRALARDGVEVRALLTTVTEEYERVSMHGVRRKLVASQAETLGIPLVEVPIPPSCPNEVYEERMETALGSPPLDDLEAVAFGDLFLDDVRAYREERLAASGKRAVFPLWGADTRALAHTFVRDGFRARIVCLDPGLVPRDLAGHSYDLVLLAELPDEVDPCGENGEFHTFVHDGPLFGRAVPCIVGEVVDRDGFVFCDLLSA